ncbi:PP2C family protein-serine/threonine phosphatase [Streptomyces sp. NPDC026673]|uniref:PP2C family protein-serine/threonine phosphatase n=1 Tax=Streptomyces sp. NPDC026673 TaxID=3155724 RepID=UPI003401BA03
MTDPGRWTDRAEERTMARLALIGGTVPAVFTVFTVCAAVPVCRRQKVACHVMGLATAPVAAVAFGRLHRRYRRRVADARAVSDAVHRVLLRPLPARIGGLALASGYHAGGGRARVGGDLYAVARTDTVTRVIIGDVRGRGLSSFPDVIAILGSFREWAPRAPSPADLSTRLEASFVRYLADADPDTHADAAEHFATALILEVPDGEAVARMVDFGHPPPVRARSGEVVMLSGTPCPPLGLSPLCDLGAHESAFELGPCDTLLLYTDGLVEARDRAGVCFPLLERAATWTWDDRLRRCDDRLRDVLAEILEDIVAHCGALPADDLAMVAPARHTQGGGAVLPHPADPDPSEGRIRPLRPD